MEGAKRGKNFFDRNSRYRADTDTDTEAEGGAFEKTKGSIPADFLFLPPSPFWREMAGRSVSQSFFWTERANFMKLPFSPADGPRRGKFCTFDAIS